MCETSAPLLSVPSIAHAYAMNAIVNAGAVRTRDTSQQ
jgi:hypothetical protein